MAINERTLMYFQKTKLLNTTINYYYLKHAILQSYYTIFNRGFFLNYPNFL